MANLDGTAQFEFHRMQLTTSLTAVAESMRNSAKMADTFANIIKQSSFAPNSPAMHMIKGMNQVLPDNNVYALNGSAPGPSGPPQTPASATLPIAALPRATGGKRKAATLEEGVEGGKAKRTRKPKDPNAPKRPASSYILFQNDIRKELKAKHPNISNSDLLAMIAKQWQAMSDEDKTVYNQATASAKERYSADKKAYEARTPEEIAAADAATAAAAALKKATPRTRTPKVPVAAATVPTPASAPAQSAAQAEASTSSESSEESSSEESSEEEEERDEDDDEDEDEEDEEPAPKKTKKTLVTATVTPVRKERRKKMTKT